VDFGGSWWRVRLGTRSVAAAVLATWATVPPANARTTASSEILSGSLLSDTEKEAFLREGEVVGDHSIPEGVTLPRRVTLRRGGYEHDAKVQTHDEHRSQLRLGATVEMDFRDTWRNNVAAYRLDRLLGLGFVPVTVVREYRGKPAAWTWWVDDVLMSEKGRIDRGGTQPPHPLDWICQNQVVAVFDQLIHNFDRSAENLLIDEDWRVWMIDHTRAFKIFGELRKQKALPARCERHLLAALRELDRATLEKTMDGLLNGQQIDGLLERRDKIVRFYDAQVAERGDSVVLYELPSRLATADSGREPSRR
jgi:hypothetical protein